MEVLVEEVTESNPKKSKMVGAEKAFPRDTFGRNFAAPQGTADLPRAGSAEVIATVPAGSPTPVPGNGADLGWALSAIDGRLPNRRTCVPPRVELRFRETLAVQVHVGGVKVSGGRR